ncbi:MAG: 2-hydroxyacid dehydrogenase [Candidatus Thorarchaeota archaeon]
MKVLVPYPDRVADIIRNILGDTATVVQSDRNPESMLAVGADADVVTGGRIPGEYIRNAPSLKMIQAFGAGIDKIDHTAVLERNDLIVCNSHINAAEVAEYTIMLLLSAAKHILISDKEFRNGDWNMGWGGPLPNIELRGKICLFLGLGNIGTAIAERLKGFNVRLYAATRTGKVKQTDLVEKAVPISDVKSIVGDADFVILSLPLTKQSEGLVDKDFLSLMKSTALLVNISRGQIVVESALYDSLKTKQIAGAALDVWWEYPDKHRGSGTYPSEKYAFHELDNVVISPHRAAYSENIMYNQMQFVGENILKFIRGEISQNIVDMTLGY